MFLIVSSLNYMITCNIDTLLIILPKASKERHELYSVQVQNIIKKDLLENPSAEFSVN